MVERPAQLDLRDLLWQIAERANLGELLVERQLSNAVTGRRWLLNSADGRMVLSLDTPLGKALGIDRSFQFDMLGQLHALNLSPKPLYRDASSGVLLVSYLEGETPGSAFSIRRSRTRQLAEMFRQLHAIKLQCIAPGTDFLSRVANYAEIAEDKRAGRLLASILSSADLWSESGPVLCHNDAHRRNFISGERLRLIDWDYAGQGPAWFDLVTLIEGFELSARARADFLDAYFGGRNAWCTEHLAAWLDISRMLESLWKSCIAA